MTKQQWDALPPEVQYSILERAAIIEFDAKITRADASRCALDELRPDCLRGSCD